MALIVLARLRRPEPADERIEPAIELATEWLAAMQCRNGGWGAFDKDNDKAILTRIPFSDFGETLDPPSVDVTAHVLEGLGMLGMRADSPMVARALDYVRAEQEPEGSWFGRWGVNHIYGHRRVAAGTGSAGRGHEHSRGAQGRPVDRRAPERGRRLGRVLHVIHGRHLAWPRAQHRLPRPRGR